MSERRKEDTSTSFRNQRDGNSMLSAPVLVRLLFTTKEDGSVCLP